VVLIRTKGQLVPRVIMEIGNAGVLIIDQRDSGSSIWSSADQHRTSRDNGVVTASQEPRVAGRLAASAAFYT
jgi:hypothetical protein